jgi:sn-glycerol 3-phosphate transport system ATP-binding protein
MNLVPLDYLRDGKHAMPAKLPAETDIIGIRPDSMLLEAPADPATTITGTLELLEPAGGESHLYVRLEGSGQSVVARAQGRPNLTEGAPVSFYVRHADFHPFNQETRKRTD